MSLNSLRQGLRAHADRKKAALLKRFFKTGPGEYGEGDVFLGVQVPQVRAVARAHRRATRSEVLALLRSGVHEERLLALLIIVGQFEKAGPEARRSIFRFYLAHSRFINNWDLVDLSSHAIVGGYLADKDRSILYRLARSPSLWERRIAIVATAHFIRLGQFRDTLAIAALLLSDKEDLLHKAAGWMLREVGKRDRKQLELFLDRHSQVMPRTMLRYALEHFPQYKRAYYLGRKNG